MKNKSNSYCNGYDPNHSAYNGNGPFRVHHAWFCACSWCLQGVK